MDAAIFTLLAKINLAKDSYNIRVLALAKIFSLKI